MRAFVGSATLVVTIATVACSRMTSRPEKSLSLLIVARLNIKSSYAENREESADSAFDTVQFYFPTGDTPSWRIRTYAMDHDIHLHRLGAKPANPIEFVRAHLARTSYREILASFHTVKIEHSGSASELHEAGLTGGAFEHDERLEFSFWNPDGAKYATKTQPVDQ